MAFDLTAQPQSKVAIVSQDIFAATMGAQRLWQYWYAAPDFLYVLHQERILAIFLRRDAAESVRFHSHGGCTYSLEVVHRDTRINFHMSNLPTLVVFLLLFSWARLKPSRCIMASGSACSWACNVRPDPASDQEIVRNAQQRLPW